MGYVDLRVLPCAGDLRPLQSNVYLSESVQVQLALSGLALAQQPAGSAHAQAELGPASGEGDGALPGARVRRDLVLAGALAACPRSVACRAPSPAARRWLLG